VAPHDAPAARAKKAAKKYRPASAVASARHAINASTTKSAQNVKSGAAVAGSMRTITGNTNSSIGDAYTTRAPSPANGRCSRSATSGTSAKKLAKMTVKVTAT